MTARPSADGPGRNTEWEFHARAPQQRYRAIFTMETDNPGPTIDRLTELVETGQMEMSEAFCMDDMAVNLYEAITPLIQQSAKPDA